MKRNPKRTLGQLRQITNGREEEHPGSRWDPKIHEATGLTFSDLRYKVWEARAKGGKSVREIARQYSVSASFVRKWHGIIQACHELRERDHHRFSLKYCSKSLSNRPKHVISPVQDSIRDAVLERRRRFPFEGSKRIKEALGFTCSISVIDRILRDAGLTRRRKRRHKPFYSRYESDRALDMIQLDYKQWNPKTWSIFAVDDRSRAILGIMVTDTATTEVAISLVKGVIERFGKPKRILTDHGCQFTRNNEVGISSFDAFCSAEGIEHVMGRVKHPETQGKIERTHRTAKEEAPSFGSLDDTESARATLLAWSEYYNFERPHYALKHRTPMDVLLADIGSCFEVIWNEDDRPKVFVRRPRDLPRNAPCSGRYGTGGGRAGDGRTIAMHSHRVCASVSVFCLF